MSDLTLHSTRLSPLGSDSFESLVFLITKFTGTNVKLLHGIVYAGLVKRVLDDRLLLRTAYARFSAFEDRFICSILSFIV